MICLDEKYLEIIREIVNREIRDEHAELYLFGSRARGENRQTSDIDLALRSDTDLTSTLVRLREKFEESLIPYEVDVLQLEKAGEAFQEEIKREGVLIWKK